MVNHEGLEAVMRFESGCRIQSDHMLIQMEIDWRGEIYRVKKEKKVIITEDWSEEGINRFREKLEDFNYEWGVE